MIVHEAHVDHFQLTQWTAAGDESEAVVIMHSRVRGTHIQVDNVGKLLT